MRSSFFESISLADAFYYHITFRKISYCKNSYFFNQYSSLSLHMLYNICNLPTRILQMKIII